MGWYFTFVLTAAGCEWALDAFAPSWLPGWTGGYIRDLLKDSAGFLLTVQVGILGVISVAVGLVTLIAQRNDGSGTNSEIRIYYDGTQT